MVDDWRSHGRSSRVLTISRNKHKKVTLFIWAGGGCMKASITRALVLTITATFLWTTTNVSTADTFRPVVRGRRGVVAGGHPLSVEAGMGGVSRRGKGGGVWGAAALWPFRVAILRLSFSRE